MAEEYNIANDLSKRLEERYPEAHVIRDAAGLDTWIEERKAAGEDTRAIEGAKAYLEEYLFRKNRTLVEQNGSLTFFNEFDRQIPVNDQLILNIPHLDLQATADNRTWAFKPDGKMPPPALAADEPAQTIPVSTVSQTREVPVEPVGDNAAPTSPASPTPAAAADSARPEMTVNTDTGAHSGDEPGTIKPEGFLGKNAMGLAAGVLAWVIGSALGGGLIGLLLAALAFVAVSAMTGGVAADWLGMKKDASPDTGLTVQTSLANSPVIQQAQDAAEAARDVKPTGSKGSDELEADVRRAVDQRTKTETIPIQRSGGSPDELSFPLGKIVMNGVEYDAYMGGGRESGNGKSATFDRIEYVNNDHHLMAKLPAAQTYSVENDKVVNPASNRDPDGLTFAYHRRQLERMLTDNLIAFHNDNGNVTIEAGKIDVNQNGKPRSFDVVLSGAMSPFGDQVQVYGIRLRGEDRQYLDQKTYAMLNEHGMLTFKTPDGQDRQINFPIIDGKVHLTQYESSLLSNPNPLSAMNLYAQKHLQEHIRSLPINEKEITSGLAKVSVERDSKIASPALSADLPKALADGPEQPVRNVGSNPTHARDDNLAMPETSIPPLKRAERGVPESVGGTKFASIAYESMPSFDYNPVGWKPGKEPPVETQEIRFTPGTITIHGKEHQVWVYGEVETRNGKVQSEIAHFTRAETVNRDPRGSVTASSGPTDKVDMNLPIDPKDKQAVIIGSGQQQQLLEQLEKQFNKASPEPEQAPPLADGLGPFRKVNERFAHIPAGDGNAALPINPDILRDKGQTPT